MAPVFSKPALIEVVETSSALASSDGHHKQGVIILVVVVAIAGVSIVYLAYRLVTMYLKVRPDNQESPDLETIDVLAVEDVEKGPDPASSVTASPFVFVPADAIRDETAVLSSTPLATVASSTAKNDAPLPLISAFSRVECEDDDDHDDDENPTEDISNAIALFTRPSPNMLNFWMKPDPAFISTGGANGRRLVIGGKTFILDEVVVKQCVSAHKTVIVHDAAKDLGGIPIQGCVAHIEEWPVQEEPAIEEATSEDAPAPQSEIVYDIAEDVEIEACELKIEESPAEDAREPASEAGPVPIGEVSASVESMSIPAIASTPSPSPTPIQGKEPSSNISRKPLATLKANIPLLRGTWKKPSLSSPSLKPTSHPSPSPFSIKSKVPCIPAKGSAKVMTPNTPTKSAGGSNIQKSGSIAVLPSSSRGSLFSKPTIAPELQKMMPSRSISIKKSVSLPSTRTPRTTHISITPLVLIPSPRSTLSSMPETPSPRAKSKPGSPDAMSMPKPGLETLKLPRSSLGGKMGIGITPRAPTRPLAAWR